MSLFEPSQQCTTKTLPPVGAQLLLELLLPGALLLLTGGHLLLAGVSCSNGMSDYFCVEPDFLWHVVRSWSTETHTFICAWGEFTQMLEDNMGNVDLFHYDIPPVDDKVYKNLKKGAPTFPSKALWLNEME
ncbi:hypothetical protein C1H46_039614 [Malus baccata]|uniref:Uncharacterized protein n=1 Tax=Malus baccata TaxID=106549 RepID=A0A540KKW3_MALBA|nr:hypothetical protein C1H46_039614 [Malus baccata]